jgi:dihydroorotate dehydrogenase (fumarate)
MTKLTTNYLGLELKSPVIAGASNLTDNPVNVKQMEEAGAGAVVFKSLFEEQIQLERFQHDEALEANDDLYAEMTTLFPRIEHAGPKAHLQSLKKVIEAVNIPVIASLNCVNQDTWVEYAKQLQDTGASALELNFYFTPTDFDKSPEEVENSQIKALESVVAAVNIPVSVKLSHYYSNPLQFMKKLENAGAKGFILFNKLFQSNIDIDKEELQHPYYLSSEGEYKDSMRFIALMNGQTKASLVGNTSIFHGREVVKMLLAGADAVQVVSALYKFQIDHIKTLNSKVESWMDEKGYETLNDFKGKLSRKNLQDPYAYLRSQYVDILLNSKQIFDDKGQF